MSAGAVSDPGGSEWRARLARLGLVPDDATLGARLQRDVIRPNEDQIIGVFHASLEADEDARSFLSDPDLVARLKESHRAYLRTLGEGLERPDYRESRIRIGETHARIGLPLGLYVAAYAALQCILLERIPEADAPARSDWLPLASFALRVTALDMALAAEAYHAAEVRSYAYSIQELESVRKRLLSESSTDALMGIANRKHVLDELRRALASAEESASPLSVVMADLDHFKDINDTFGHLVGDEVLRDVSRRVSSTLRDTDSVGRFGGEEFLVVLRQTTAAVGARVAERIRRRIGSNPVACGELLVPVRVSMGLAEMAGGESLDSLIGRADEALLEAKRAGRDRVVVAPTRPA